MKINITKNEYRFLLDILSISSWVMTSHQVEKDEKTAPYEALEQKILSYAKEYGFEKLVDYDKNRNEYSPSWEYGNLPQFNEFLDEYNDDTFWDSLEDRLSRRDLIEEIGAATVHNMEPLDRMKEEDKFMGKYVSEFAKNGLKNLRLILPPDEQACNSEINNDE